MVQTMARQESDSDVLARLGGLVVQHANRRRGSAPWCIDVEGGSESKARQRLQASAANDSNVNGICMNTRNRAAKSQVLIFSKCCSSPCFGAAFTGICACDVCHFAEAYVYVANCLYRRSEKLELQRLLQLDAFQH